MQQASQDYLSFMGHLANKNDVQAIQRSARQVMGRDSDIRIQNRYLYDIVRLLRIGVGTDNTQLTWKAEPRWSFTRIGDIAQIDESRSELDSELVATLKRRLADQKARTYPDFAALQASRAGRQFKNFSAYIEWFNRYLPYLIHDLNAHEMREGESYPSIALERLRWLIDQAVCRDDVVEDGDYAGLSEILESSGLHYIDNWLRKSTGQNT